jgi:hypothetical protein
VRHLISGGGGGFVSHVEGMTRDARGGERLLAVLDYDLLRWLEVGEVWVGVTWWSESLLGLDITCAD